MLIDSHVHLDNPKYDPDRDEVLERSRAEGVTRWILPAISAEAARAALTAPWRPPGMYIAAGFHPNEVADLDPGLLPELDQLFGDHPELVAVGETGLDFHYGADYAEKQIRFLEYQIALAERVHKPMILHVRSGAKRSAYADILAMIRTSSVKGVLHCFTGSMKDAREAVELGWKLGFNGVATFKNSLEIRDALASIPPENILLETDGPYMAPVPHRGKRNEPSFISRILEHAAPLYGLKKEELALLTTRSSEELFGLPKV